MVVGDFSTAPIPTDFGPFRIYVLPELVTLGEKDAKPVAVILDHYAMVPQNLGGAKFFQHQTNLYKDLFLPTARGARNLPERVLERIGRSGEGVLFYFDEIEPQGLAALQKDLDKTATLHTAGSGEIIERFADHLKIMGRPQVIQTRPHDILIPSHMGRIDIHRHNETVDVEMPSKMVEVLFPDGAASDVALRKYLSHFALVNSIQHIHEWEGLPIVRLHSSCKTGDLNAAHTCDCGRQFRIAMTEVFRDGWAVVYDDAEARAAHHLAAKMHFYNESALHKLHTYEAMEIFGYEKDPTGYGPDLRKYRGPAALMKNLGMSPIILGSNNKHKQCRLGEADIEVLGRIQVLNDEMTPERERYLKQKLEFGGHHVEELFIK